MSLPLEDGNKQEQKNLLECSGTFSCATRAFSPPLFFFASAADDVEDDDEDAEDDIAHSVFVLSFSSLTSCCCRRRCCLLLRHLLDTPYAAFISPPPPLDDSNARPRPLALRRGLRTQRAGTALPQRKPAMDLTNRIYVDLAEKDRAVQVVSYAATARGEAVDSSASVAEAKRLAQADDLSALVKLAFNQAAGIFAGPDKGPSHGSCKAWFPAHAARLMPSMA